jgi:hypothetical protein
LQIEGIIDFPVPPENAPPLPRTVSTYTRKVSAYADDATLLVKLDYKSLLRIKEVLEEFGLISGLVCNVEKTMLVVIGDNEVIDNRIETLGFVISKKVTILGLEINNNGFAVESLHKITEKISNQIGIWRRFNLSLPGRINIAKTMMYSQINYLGSFLPIPRQLLVDWDKLITDFVKGKLNIARSRLFLPPAEGGIGLFDVSDFLDAQKCTWIRRSADLTEPWKVLLFYYNHGNLFNSKARNINSLEFPIIHGICTSYERMTNFFTSTNENFKMSYIFENSKITKTLETRTVISRAMFSADFFRANAEKLYKLKYSNFYGENGVVIARERILETTGLDLTALQYFEIRNACCAAKVKFNKKELKQQVSIDIETYINRRRRGSSHLRKLFNTTNQQCTPHNIRKFAENMDVIISGDQARILNGMWTSNIYSNVEKTFLFKLHNNTLGYNNMVAHFVRGHSANCTFCTITQAVDPNPESPSHLFYDCHTVSIVVENIFKRLTNDNNFTVGRRDFFATFDYREFSIARNRILTIASKLVMKYIWDCKTRKTLPVFENGWDLLAEKIEYLIASNNSFRTMWNSCNLNLQ